MFVWYVLSYIFTRHCTQNNISTYTTNSRNEFTDQILQKKRLNIEKLKSSMEHEKCRQDHTKLIFSSSDFLLKIIGRVWRYQRGNQNPYIEEEQITQWSKERVKTTIYKTYT